MPESAWQTPIEVDGHMLTHTHPHVGWPTEELAEYLWPPSVYQAARFADLVSSPWQQPSYSTTSEYATIDDIDMSAWPGMMEHPLYQEISFDGALPQPADSSGIQHGSIVTAQGQLTRGDLTAKKTQASASSISTEHKANETNMSW